MPSSSSATALSGINHHKAYTIIETPAVTLQILEDLSSTDDCEDDDDQDNLEDSIGRFVWPTAVPLLRHLLLTNDDDDDEDDDDNKRKHCGGGGFQAALQSYSMLVIVELGAGCGVLGMGLAAAASAVSTTAAGETRVHVILTDHDADWLQQNVALNETKILRHHHPHDTATTTTTTMSVTRLEWGNANDIETVQTMIVKQLSMHSHNNNNSDDDDHTKIGLWLVGSDVLYNHHSHRSLARTLHQLSQPFVATQAPLTQPSRLDVRILLGFPDRNHDEAHFVPMAKEFLGDTFPASSSHPIIPRRDQNGRAIRTSSSSLRIIDFNVP